MASFCKQCAEELDFEADYTNMFKDQNIEPDGGETYFRALCETCGVDCWIIDNEGTCASPYCFGSMRTNKPHGRMIDGKASIA